MPGRTDAARETRQFQTGHKGMPAMSVPAVGETVDGKYTVTGLLGRGAMGLVLRAHDEQLARDVAIKFVHPEAVARKGVLEGLLSEARTMARVRHPNVVEVYAFGELEGAPYFVMEYVEGTDLDEWTVAQDRLLSVDEVAGIMEQVCAGVGAIHDAGAVHRDLKPNNILIGKGFRMKVADLGLAQPVDPSEPHDGIVAGTPAFMPPEVISKQEIPARFAPRVDIYALGVIAYELLTGQDAYTGDVRAVLAAHMRHPVPTPSNVRPELSPAFDALIHGAMAKQPAARIPDVRSFQAALSIARQQARGGPVGQVRVAVIDDDAGFIRWVEKIVASEMPDAEVIPIRDPRQAIRRLRAEAPTVILLDLQMPEINGMELAAMIRADVSLSETPIVVCTAAGGPEDWQFLERMGVNAFQVKPLHPAALMALLRHWKTDVRASG